MLDGRILCFDVGQRRVGIAISDPLGFTAQGVGFFENNGIVSFTQKINELTAQYGKISKIIIGYPLNLDGREGAKAASIREFSEELGEAISISVELSDERFSTKQAQWALKENNISTKKQQKIIDMLAAQVILQGYLETHTI